MSDKTKTDLLGNPEPEITTRIQRKLKRELPDNMRPPRDIPKPPKQATGYLTIRQAKGGHYAVGVIGDKQSSIERINSLNELLTLVGDWASGQYNEQKE